MPRVLRVAFAAMLLALTPAAGRSAAAAESVAHFDDPFPSRPSVETKLIFSGFDIWHEGASLHGGLIWSPGGLDRSGFALKLLAAGGTYRYRSSVGPEVGRFVLAAALPGWRFKAGSFELTAFLGPEAQQHRITPNDPGNRLLGFHLGLRTGVDVWYEPTRAMMIAASLWGASIGTSYWSRVALGWRIGDVAWAGPEIGAQGDSTYRQWRVGLHATALRTGPFEWRASAGFVSDSDNRSGAYTTLGVLTRR